MTTTYNYSLSSDFGGNLKSQQLHEEIGAESGITPNIIAVNTDGDLVDIVFDSSLSGGEETTLNGLVASHIPDTSKPRKQFFSITPKKDVITPKNSWVLSTYFQYPGSDKVGLIDYIDVICSMNPGVNSYDVRIINKKTGEVIAEKTNMTNIVAETQDLGTISNVPTDKSTLELQIKKIDGNNSKKVEVEQVIIYYGN